MTVLYGDFLHWWCHSHQLSEWTWQWSLDTVVGVLRRHGDDTMDRWGTVHVYDAIKRTCKPDFSIPGAVYDITTIKVLSLDPKHSATSQLVRMGQTRNRSTYSAQPSSATNVNSK